MSRKNLASFLIIVLLFTIGAKSQDTIIKPGLNGYLTAMQSVIFDSLSGNFINENLLHNRLNFKFHFNDHLSFSVETRNRLFTGDMVRLGESYSGMISNDPGLMDLSWNLVEEKSFLFNTTIDRIRFDARFRKFELTIGRQRINWGQAFVWNPNDIFNTYSFFDFDYIERPGSDAVRFQYFPSFASAVEAAVKVNSEDEITAAGLFRFNRWSCDFQFLGGVVDGEDIVVGTGWSGVIESLSFRGEASWFQPLEKHPRNRSTVLITSGIDRVFNDNSIAQVQVMYCNKPLDLTSFTSFYSGALSAKELAFSRFSAFGQFSWAATPLLNMVFSAMWLPDISGYFAGPSLDYSLAGNLGFTLIWQHFNSVMNGDRERINLAFLRIKYSF
jgi:hypothetical protein